MGSLHNLDFENGWKVNYSLFYKYDNFVNKMRSCNYLFNRNTPYTKVEGKENLTFGTELSYKFKDNQYLNSCTAKFVVNDQGVKISESVNLKGYGDLFESSNLNFKANVNIL